MIEIIKWFSDMEWYVTLVPSLVNLPKLRLTFLGTVVTCKVQAVWQHFCPFVHPDFMLLNIHDWMETNISSTHCLPLALSFLDMVPKNQVVFHSARLDMAAVIYQVKRKATEIIAMQDHRLA